jgi:GntR family transcriptional regulator/MocR family aminotransferase
MLAPSDQTRQQAVFDRLRHGILTGTLPPGTRLPPSRNLAEELGVSRQTVVLAYERLMAEGYARARVGTGTYVAPELPDAAPPPAAPSVPATAALSRRGALLAATPASTSGTQGGQPGLLAPGIPAPELFPAASWAAATARVLRSLPPALTAYPDPQGLSALRTEIARHLAASRGLVADPGQIVVTAGVQQALRVAAELLLDPGDTAWVEDPGYVAGRGALIAAGARIVPVPSDSDGIEVAQGIARAPAARLALVAPSHATPIGGALPVARRLTLLDWAARAAAWVLEDDADSEFRWQGKPLPPLATLDRAGRVIYCGTFSKTLAPALRLGFAVVPAPLVPGFVRARTLMDRGPDALTQAALAEFMRQGLLATHTRRMRTEYARRREAVLAALARHCPEVTPLVAPGGLHMVFRLPDGADETAITAAARARGLSVAPLGAYFAGPPRLSGVVAGFAATPPPLAADAARRLSASIRGGTGPT